MASNLRSPAEVTTRGLLERSLEILDRMGVEDDKDHPDRELMEDIKYFLHSPDNPPVRLNVTSSPFHKFEMQLDFDFADQAMSDLAAWRYPQDMVMLPAMQDLLEAWNRFKIAWYG
jgi:hypothetical protein